MMDETEIKHEFPCYENQCYVCFSVGRKLSFLGEYVGIFRKIISDIDIYPSTTIEQIKICWECHACLRKVHLLHQQVVKANEIMKLEQTYLYGTQSHLTTIILNDMHPNTIYINDLNIQTDIKSCDNYGNYGDDNDDRINDDDGDEICEEECVKSEEIVQENTSTLPDTNTQCKTNIYLKNSPKESNIASTRRKAKNNRWAEKRAQQNKKPKFKILTTYSRRLFRRVQIAGEELQGLMKSERDSVYFNSMKFRCERCVLVFKSEGNLLKHFEDFHSKSKKYSCDICTSFISNKFILSRHIRDHYNKYTCILCDFSCYDKSQKRWHYHKTHRKVFQCLKCELKFGSRWEFFKHYKEWHEKFVCDHCGISFKMRYCIKDHIRKQHSPFECKQCNKRWARYNGLWLHNKTTHSTHNTAYCVECDKQYRDVYRYRWHLANSARHTQRKKHRIPCPGCDKIFSKNIYMKDHYNLVHLKYYKYRCEQCDKNFIRNADLVKHTRRVHEGILPPKNKICYVCGRGFTTNEILRNHVRTHTGERPYSCAACSARFAQRTALSAHARAIHHTTANMT